MRLYERRCCDGWFSEEEEVNGECPECGMLTVDDYAAHGCNYSPVSCETCGHRACDESCYGGCMSLNTDQNKRIEEALEGVYPIYCMDGRIHKTGFDTREGFFLIVENGPKQSWWKLFVHENKHIFTGNYDWAVKQDYIGPALAVELSKWLEGREK